MNNTTLKLFGIIQVVFAALILFLLNDSSPINLTDEKKFVVGIYDDASEGGNSTIKQFDKNTFEASIGSAYEHAFAGIYFQKTDRSFFTLEKKETLNLDISSDVDAEIHVGFEKFQSGAGSRPFRYNEIVQVGPNHSSISLPIENFKTPIWWMEENPNASTEEELDSDIISLNIEVKNVSNNDKVKLKIEELSLSKAENEFRYPIAGGLFLIGMILIAYDKKKGLSSENSVPKEEAMKHENPIIYYINSNFTSRSLTINSTSEHFKLSVEYINERVKTETGMQFKDYLNQLRVEKSKKLLKETEEKAFEIAQLCGFNSSASFSQTFKLLTGLTPNEFRKKP